MNEKIEACHKFMNDLPSFFAHNDKRFMSYIADSEKNQLNNGEFPVLSPKYVCKAVSGYTKVPSSKFISNVVAKSLCKFFLFVNSLVYLYLLKASVALLIVL